MKFSMDRESGMVTFTELQPGSKIYIIWPEIEQDAKPKKQKGTVVDKNGVAQISFANKREIFLRKVCTFHITHDDYEDINVRAEIRMTKLIPIIETTQKRRKSHE